MEIEDASIAAGLAQLERYLSRAWFRAGVAAQLHVDCSQEVYASLLRILGRARFDQMVGTVGRRGIPQVLNRESSIGPDFFRGRRGEEACPSRATVPTARGERRGRLGPRRRDPGRMARGLAGGHQSFARQTRGLADLCHAQGRDTRRDRLAMGRRPQNRQQREDARPPEAPQCPRRRPRSLSNSSASTARRKPSPDDRTHHFLADGGSRPHRGLISK